MHLVVLWSLSYNQCSPMMIGIGCEDSCSSNNAIEEIDFFWTVRSQLNIVRFYVNNFYDIHFFSLLLLLLKLLVNFLPQK